MSVATKERPILFRGEMVRAILDGRKTQTRRAIKQKPITGTRMRACPGCGKASCPYGQPGDRLWVRETWRTWEDPKTLIDGITYQADGGFREIENTREAAERWAIAAHRKPSKSDYKPVRTAGQGHLGVATLKKHVGWRPSIFMPRWASRLTLEITDMRFERLNDISHEDALAEGCEGCNWVASSPYFVGPHTDDGELPQEEYRRLWESINGRGSWDANPLVWVISFRRVD